MRIARATFGVMIFGILCASAAAQESKSTDESSPLPRAASANDATTTLQRALHFADLYNWHASRPYFTRAQQLFEAADDKRNALYAHFGAIRAGADPAPITEIAYWLAQELATNPILQSDKELRIFSLIVKGDFDGEIDVPAMRRDWTEVAALAREMANTKWQYRAQGQLGFADFYDGDLTSAQRNVGAALIAATNAGDVGAQIFYLTATANGLLSQQMNDQAIVYADRAITIADANPDAGYPVLAEHARLLAMLQGGRMEGARTELARIISCIPGLAWCRFFQRYGVCSRNSGRSTESGGGPADILRRDLGTRSPVPSTHICVENWCHCLAWIVLFLSRSNFASEARCTTRGFPRQRRAAFRA